MSSILFGGYYGTQWRVRLYPPLGYNILFEEYYLTRFNHKKTLPILQSRAGSPQMCNPGPWAEGGSMNPKGLEVHKAKQFRAAVPRK